MSGTSCMSNYIVIPNPMAVGGNALGVDRFCGTAFNTIQSKWNCFQSAELSVCSRNIQQNG